jgi:hypothetical protein
MRTRKENVKFIVLTESDRKLLRSIDRSLSDIKTGKIKDIESLIHRSKKHKRLIHIF